MVKIRLRLVYFVNFPNTPHVVRCDSEGGTQNLIHFLDHLLLAMGMRYVRINFSVNGGICVLHYPNSGGSRELRLNNLSREDLYFMAAGRSDKLAYVSEPGLTNALNFSAN